MKFGSTMNGQTEMFVSNGAMDASSLYQGDVVKDIQLLGALSYQELAVGMPATGSGAAISWTVPKPPIQGNALVLSHSCEVAKENGVKLTSIILAPLRDVSSATKPERVKELISSNLIDKTNPEASFLKYFYLEPHTEIGFALGAVADFSKLFSVRKASYEFLLSRKVAELTADVRNSMALKLALYFHRAEVSNAA